jgi:hypothetical protein
MKRLITATCVYLVIDVCLSGAWYWLTGTVQYGDVFDFRQDFGHARVSILVRLLEDALVARVLVAVVVSAVLIWLSNRTRHAAGMIAAGILLPWLLEVLLALQSENGWPGMLLAALRTWPSVPEYLMPLRLILGRAAAYVIPAIVAGLCVSLMLLRRGTGSSRGATVTSPGS